MPGELHSVGRAKGNSAGCLYGVFLIQVLKFASPLLGILVSPLFFMDNAAFRGIICLKSVLCRTQFLNDVIKLFLERENSMPT